MWMRLWIGCLALAGGLLFSSEVEAQGPGNSCTISTTSVAFGVYNVFSTSPNSSTGSIVYRCGAAVPNMTISLGQGGSGTYAARRLSGGADALTYNLYRDASASTVWGDGTAGTQTYFDADPPNNTNVTVTIYGRIPASQDVSAGSYSDSVSVVINF